jgi:PAS domain S-box-containing protein
VFAQDAGLSAAIAVPVLAHDDVVAVVEFFVWEERERTSGCRSSPPSPRIGTLFQQKAEEPARARAPPRSRRPRRRDHAARRAGDRHLNEAASRIFARPPEELVAQPLTVVLPGGVPQAALDGSGRIVEVAGRRPRAGDYTDEMEFPLEAAFSLEHGGGTFTTAMLRDVTERKAEQAAMHEADERFRGAFEQAPIGMALVSIESDRAGCFLRVNRSLSEITGYAAHELVGASFESVVDPTDDDTSDARYVPWMLAGEVPGFEVEKRLRRANGETIVVMLSVSLVRGAGERLYLIAQMQDVTARKRAEALVEPENVQAIIDNTAAVIYEGHGGSLYARQPQLRGLGIERERDRTLTTSLRAGGGGLDKTSDRRVIREHVPLEVER